MFTFQNLNQSLIGLSKLLLEEGIARETRGFACIEYPRPILICIENPCDRYVTIPSRKWNKILPFAESLWLALGLNDLDALPGTYVKNLYNFSDNGKTWRGGYGTRFRNWAGLCDDYYISDRKEAHVYTNTVAIVDQFKFVIDTLKRDINSRQAGITVHDPARDDFDYPLKLKETKDQPCTRLIHFQMMGGKLDCTVFLRSNDCFTYDTKIPLLNGEVWEIGKLVEEFKDKSFWVYSRDEKGNIVPGLAHHPRKTKRVKQLIKVTLDNGEIIKCTPDHRFMLKDGTYKEVSNIKLGESLSPFYRNKLSKNKDYECVYTGGGFKSTYKIVHQYFNGVQPEGTAIHHKDFNKHNNNPENLELLGIKEHLILHQENVGELNAALWDENNPKYRDFEEQRKKILKGLKIGNRNSWKKEGRKELQSSIMSEVNKFLWEDREGFREYMKPIQVKSGQDIGAWVWNSKDPEAEKIRNKIKKAASKRMNSPEIKEHFRKLTTERNNKNWDDPEYRKKMLESLKKFKNSPKEKERMREYMLELSKKQKLNPNYHSHMKSVGEKGMLGKIVRVFRDLEEEGVEITEENYNIGRLKYYRIPSMKFINEKFGSFESAKAELLGNHKIIKKEIIETDEFVYDITVDKYNNFALESGVFVHNCIWGYSAVNVFNFTLIQEYIANILGVPVGKYYHFANNLHFYENFKENIQSFAAEDPSQYESIGEFYYQGKIESLEKFDENIDYIYSKERALVRKEPFNANFELDMFDDWFKVFYNYWNKEANLRFKNPYLNRLFYGK